MARSAVLSALVLLMSGCGGSSGLPVAPTEARVAAALAPASLAPRPCQGCGAGSTDLEVAATLTLAESAGVAATVETVAMTLRGDAGGTLAQGQLDAAVLTRLAGSNRIAAGGTLAVPVAVHFTPAAAAQLPAKFIATATSVDASGRRATVSASARVTVPAP